jgi:hypothetical protein
MTFLEGNNHRRTFLRFVVVASATFTLSFSIGTSIFFLLKAFLSHTPITYPYKMIAYPEQHPLQYAIVLAAPHAFLTAIWTLSPPSITSRWRWLQITTIILAAVAISSVLGGILWTFHDMQAGYFPPYDRLVNDFREGAWSGLTIGPDIVVLSTPLNIIAFLVLYLITNSIERIGRPGRTPGFQHFSRP